ncbi:hypothetical protein ACH4MO_36770 [Streptomyces globisporus]|uniref:hypothetical protein n=1 Tax=Streptomyces globisporus TaxID=1908 RepID=UPI0037B6F19C
MIALAYVISVVVGLSLLAVALRPHPATPPPTSPTPAPPNASIEADARLVLAAAIQLANRFAPAA